MHSRIARIGAASCLAVFAMLSPGAFEAVLALPQPDFIGYAYVQQQSATGVTFVARYPIASDRRGPSPDWIISGAELGQPIAVDTSGRVYMILCPLNPSCKTPFVEVFAPTSTSPFPARTFTVPPAGPNTYYVVTALQVDGLGRIYVGLNRLPAGSASVEIFAANATGVARPIKTIHLSGQATALAFASTGDLVVDIRGQVVDTYATPVTNPKRVSTIVLPAEPVSRANGGVAVASNGDIYVGVSTSAILEYSAGSHGLLPPNRLWFPSLYDGNGIGVMSGVLFFAWSFPGPGLSGGVGDFGAGKMNDSLPDVVDVDQTLFGDLVIGPRDVGRPADPRKKHAGP